MAFTIALAILYAFIESQSVIRGVELFVAISMILLALQKLKDLYGFSDSFITYDLLAMSHVRYAYVYPFAEAFAGIGMLASLSDFIVGPISLFIGSVGAILIFKAVYVDKRELRMCRGRS